MATIENRIAKLERRAANTFALRLKEMTDDEIEALIVAHSTPEDYARIAAMTDAELEAAIMGATT
jgi:hypothetical protein